MKRRDFFRNSFLTTLGLGALSTVPVLGQTSKASGRAKNIIFLVSDGMSSGTLNLADILLRHKEGKTSNWINYYQDGTLKRALMDTASANSFVTDSAAAGSAWGGGMRVNNGSLNIGPNGEKPVPILQKFKAAGKSVGCVTTVQITHATPASFCVNNNSRNAMESIAEDYLQLRFDVMMGGGADFFDSAKRSDKKNLFDAFSKGGFDVIRSKEQLAKANGSKPILGVFAEDGLPYAIDRINDKKSDALVPSLAEMTKKAIDVLKKNPKGFVMQVEAGKVDWAAHGNDATALLYDQLEFDAAIKVAVDFAKEDKETLIIVTTDHGNSNPGLFSTGQGSKNFERIHKSRASNEWILQQIKPGFTASQVSELVNEYQQIPLSTENAQILLKSYQLDAEGMYNPGNLPFHSFATMQSQYNSIQWAGSNHSGDFVELGLYGPGSEAIPGFVKNYELHEFMLKAAEINSKDFA
jgi:alkaline phosphatase